jgi:hypothetical protein
MSLLFNHTLVVLERLAELSVQFSCSSCGNTCQEPPIYALFCYDFYSFCTSVFTFSLTQDQELYIGRKGLFLWAGRWCAWYGIGNGKYTLECEWLSSKLVYREEL